MEIIERQHADKHIATSSDYTAQALRAVSPPRPQQINAFDPHCDLGSNCQQAQADLDVIG